MELFKTTDAQKKSVLDFNVKERYMKQKYYDISDAVEINDELLRNICPNLLSLSIHKKNISENELGLILQNSKNLEKLEIWGLTLIFEGLNAIEGYHHNLKHLDIAECPNLGNLGMFLISEKFPNIEDLTLGPFCYGTLEGFEYISQKYTTLISLELDMCEISERQLKYLIERCPNLIAVHIEHSNNLRSGGLEGLFLYLSNKYPNLALNFH